MTTVEFIARLGSSLSKDGEDYTNLPSAKQLALLDAMNDAIRQWFMAVPSRLSRAPINLSLPAPVTLSLDLTAGSAAVQTNAFTLEQQGRSLLIDGDDVWNEVAGVSSLSSTYSGSSGTHAATLYADAYAFRDLGIVQLLSDPVCLETKRPLVLDETIWRNDVRYRRDQARTRLDWLSHGNGIADPTHYNVVSAGSSRNIRPVDILHIFPRPARALRYVFDALLAPCRFPLTVLIEATELPVPDHHCTTELLPIARGLLVAHPSFQGDAKLVLGAAQAAVTAASTVADAKPTPHRRVRTRRGF